MRSCVGCRRRAPWTELVRCARLADGALTISRLAPGRGAWVCAGSLECFDRAVRARGFDRAWRRPVASEQVAGLRSAFAALAVDVGESTIARGTGAVPTLVKG